MKKFLLSLFLLPFISFSQNCNNFLIHLNDSLGDGWNGNYISIIDSIGNTLYSATLDSGSYRLDSVCLPDDCYTIVCDSGTSQSEVLWWISDEYDRPTGIFGGAPYNDTICLTSNCTPPFESFEILPITWTNGVYTGFGQTTDLPWVRNQGSTPTFNTGPTQTWWGNWYMYLECGSFPAGSYATLTANCVNPSNYSNLHLSFQYHMYGATTGELKVEVSTDGGLTWVTEWSRAGEQGFAWWVAHVDLSHYTTEIMVRMVGVVGSSNTGDIAIDFLRLHDPTGGCKDPTADNYDQYAEIDDGSCTYTNCTFLTLNLYDSFGDGWNGNWITISSNGTTFYTNTIWPIPNGYFYTQTICVPNDECYSLTVDGGIWQNEISWEIVDTNGIIVRSGGAPFSGGFCLPFVYGCTDILATNYDSLATIDDGSCTFPLPSITANVNNISCNGQNDGSINLTVNGGVLPLSFQWSNGSNSEDIYNLSAGVYSVLVTDDIGQTDSAAFTVSEPDVFASDYVIIDASGVGINDGAIYSFVSGGTQPYDYYWLSSYGNDTTPNFVDIPAGSYTSYIIDDNGCFIFVSLSVGIDSSSNGCTDPLAFNYDSDALVDDGSCVYIGCTDVNADNYFSLATIDDGSCYYCNPPNSSPFSLSTNWITDTKAEISWENMNDECNMVWKYYVRYRELGSPNWITKSAGVGNGLCNSVLTTTVKTLQNLNPGTTYEYKMKTFYCGGTSSTYSSPEQFTTAGDCPPMAYLNVTTFNSNHQKARFNWNTYEPYVFARIALRVDVPGSNWQTAGGFGVYYPNVSVNKFGLVAGESYRALGRTFCDSNITSYRSSWTNPIFWTQPAAVRIGSNSNINNFDIYPNPTKDIFYISFTSEITQNIKIRIYNVIGAEIFSEIKESFIGDYSKQFNLENFEKGIYIIEIKTQNNIINKKIVLQ